MKHLEKILKFLPENLSEANKQSVVDFIREGIEEANENWKRQLTEKESALTEASQTIEQLKTKSEESEAEVATLREEVKELKERDAKRESEAKYQERMTMIDSEFELSEAERKVVTKKCHLPEEQFNEWYEEFSVFNEAKKKEVVEAAKAEKDAKIEELNEKIKELEVKASAKPEEKTEQKKEEKKNLSEASAEEALDNMNENKDEALGNAQPPQSSEPDLVEQFNRFRQSVRINNKPLVTNS